MPLTMKYSQKTSVTVCILTHKRPYGLERLLSALTPQVQSKKRSVVVLNDGSHNEEYQKIVDQFSSIIEYQSLNKNVGIAKARNAVAKMAKNEFIVFIDDDCVPPPFWLDWVIALLDASPDLDVVAGITRPLLVEKPSFFSRVQAVHNFIPMPQRHRDQLTFVTANLAIRRSLFVDLGGFITADDFPGAGEDTEFASRISRGSFSRKIDYNWFVFHEVGDGIWNNMKRYWRYGFGNIWMQQFTTSPSFLDDSLKYLSYDKRFPHFLRAIRHRFHEARYQFPSKLQAVSSAFIASLLDASYREGCRAARNMIRMK